MPLYHSISGSGLGGTPNYFNVRNFKALGDGVTDDTAAVQAAYTAAGAAGGGTVYIPSGTYNLSSAITGSSLVSVLGDGLSSILNQTSTSANVLTYTGTGLSNICIEKLQLQGPASGTGVGIFMSASSGANPVVAVSLRDLVVKNMGGHGVQIQTPITSTFENVDVKTNGGDGFHTTSGTSCNFLNCYANANTGHGYNLATLSYSSLNACAADSNAAGYYLDTCNNIALTACGAEATTGNSYVITGGVGTTMMSCFAAGNNAIAVYFTGTHRSGFVQGFRENAPGGSATASIQVDSGCKITLGSNQLVTASVLDANGTSQIQGGEFYCAGNGGTSSFQLNRGATTNFATYQLLTNGVEEWVVGGMLNDSTNDMHVQDAANGKNAMIFEQHSAATNVQIGNAKSFGSGIGVVGLTSATTLPTANPTGGGILYVNAGALTYRGSSGTVTVIAPA